MRDARWVCGAGDSSPCSYNSSPCPNQIPAIPPSRCTIDPTAGLYYSFIGGSNGGSCVTLFAPAKNLTLALLLAPDSYRDGRLRATLSSGTSFSAPIAAGFAARVLQNNPTYTPSQVRTALLSNSVSTLDASTLDPYDAAGNVIAGTPNKLLKLSDVNITSQPLSVAGNNSGGTTLQVQAGGTSTLHYQWFEVNSDFVLTAYRNGSASSTAIANTDSATYIAPSSTTTKAFWVRVTNSCGSSDSDIAVVVAKPQPPSNVTATLSGTQITVAWSAASGAERYEIQRKVAGQQWTVLSHPTVTQFSETAPISSGVIVYRVIAQAGLDFLPSNALANSVAVADFVNFASSNYESIVAGISPVKAQHVIELRQAVNALCDAGDIAQFYSAAELNVPNLQGQRIEASHFTTLMTNINTARTALGIPNAAFTQPPGQPTTRATIYAQSLRDLRAAVNWRGGN